METSEISSGHPHAVRMYQRYWAALLRRDVEQANQIVGTAMRSHSPQSIYLRLFLPALNLRGLKWAGGEISHHDEHYITHYTLRFMRTVRRALVVERPTGPLALAVPVAQESHRIGLRMCCDFLQADNCRILWLRGTERSLLRETLFESRPAMLMFSVGIADGIEPTRRLIAEARRSRFSGTIAVGGRAILENEASVAALGADFTAANALRFRRKVRALVRNG